MFGDKAKGENGDPEEVSSALLVPLNSSWCLLVERGGGTDLVVSNNEVLSVIRFLLKGL